MNTDAIDTVSGQSIDQENDIEATSINFGAAVGDQASKCSPPFHAQLNTRYMVSSKPP